MGRPTKYNEDVASIIIEARRRGETYEKCAILAGCDKSQIYAWKDKYQDFQEAIKQAEAEYEKNRTAKLLESAKRGLAELLSGYEYTESRTVYENDAKGNPVIKQQINTTKKVAPSATAIIFTLTNLAPDVWKNRQSAEVKTESKQDVSLANVPDDLLAQVIDAIKSK